MMKQKLKAFNLIPLFAFMMMLLASCGKEIFNPIRKQTTDTTPDVKIQNTSVCSQYTLIRPEVDILFLVDNSTSSYYLKPQVKASLDNIVNTVSSRFDYHIVLAPLIKPVSESTNPNYGLKLISRTTDNLTLDALNRRINPSKPSSAMNYSSVTGGSEAGLDRVVEIIKNNTSNGIFRSNAYTIIVVTSTEDDNSYWKGLANPSASLRNNYVSNKTRELLCMRGGYSPSSGSCSGLPNLNSKMMRLISVIPQTFEGNNRCPETSGYLKNHGAYELASKTIFDQPYNNGYPDNSSIDYSGSESYANRLVDTVNICSGQINYKNPKNTFDKVNNVIQDTVINHVYRYWPVAGAGVPVNPHTISIKTGTGDTFNYTRLDDDIIIDRDPNGTNDYISGTTNKISGWRYVADTTVNTRFKPTVGEPFTGHVIELFGNAKVSYPTCLIVKSNAPTEYFGYVYVGTAKPLESSIELRINGALIPKQPVNGWTLDSTYYEHGRNIKIATPTSDAEGNPPQIGKPGYYLKVSGSAIYSNSASVDVRWLPTSNVQ